MDRVAAIPQFAIASVDVTHARAVKVKAFEPAVYFDFGCAFFHGVALLRQAFILTAGRVLAARERQSGECSGKRTDLARGMLEEQNHRFVPMA
jgi:hypothetical protein